MGGLGAGGGHVWGGLTQYNINGPDGINKTYNILNSSNTLLKIGSYQAGLPSIISKGSLIGSLDVVSLSCSFPLFRFPFPVSISFWSMSGKTGMSTPSG